MKLASSLALLLFLSLPAMAEPTSSDKAITPCAQILSAKRAANPSKGYLKQEKVLLDAGFKQLGDTTSYTSVPTSHLGKVIVELQADGLPQLWAKSGDTYRDHFDTIRSRGLYTDSLRIEKIYNDLILDKFEVPHFLVRTDQVEFVLEPLLDYPRHVRFIHNLDEVIPNSLGLLTHDKDEVEVSTALTVIETVGPRWHEFSSDAKKLAEVEARMKENRDDYLAVMRGESPLYDGYGSFPPLLQPEESLVESVNTNRKSLEKLGLSLPQMALPLALAVRFAERGIENFKWGTHKFNVSISGRRGTRNSPFDDGESSQVGRVWVENVSTGQSLTVVGLQPKMILNYGFFGELTPEAILEVFPEIQNVNISP